MRYKQTGLDESTFVNAGVLERRLSGGRWDDQNWLLFGCRSYFCAELHRSHFNLVYLNDDSYEMTGSSPLSFPLVSIIRRTPGWAGSLLKGKSCRGLQGKNRPGALQLRHVDSFAFSPLVLHGLVIFLH